MKPTPGIDNQPLSSWTVTFLFLISQMNVYCHVLWKESVYLIILTTIKDVPLYSTLYIPNQTVWNLKCCNWSFEHFSPVKYNATNTVHIMNYSSTLFKFFFESIRCFTFKTFFAINISEIVSKLSIYFVISNNFLPSNAQMKLWDRATSRNIDNGGWLFSFIFIERFSITEWKAWENTRLRLSTCLNTQLNKLWNLLTGGGDNIFS